MELRSLIAALETTGNPLHLVRLLRGSEIPEVTDLPDSVPLVCQGPAFVPRALKHPRLRHGIFFDSARFAWSAYSDGWQHRMLAQDGCVVPLSIAQQLVFDRGRAFVRPDADSKVFDGGVYDARGFTDATQGEDMDLPVVVASPIQIEAEWRFFIVGSNLVDCSEYRRWGRPSTRGAVPRVAIEIASESAAAWEPADIYCLDLAATDDRIGIVEANCFNASRFYGASIDRLVEVVSQRVLDQWTERD
jgi:hypothetical protein